MHGGLRNIGEFQLIRHNTRLPIPHRPPPINEITALPNPAHFGLQGQQTPAHLLIIPESSTPWARHSHAILDCHSGRRVHSGDEPVVIQIKGDLATRRALTYRHRDRPRIDHRPFESAI